MYYKVPNTSCVMSFSVVSSLCRKKEVLFNRFRVKYLNIFLCLDSNAFVKKYIRLSFYIKIKLNN